MSEEMTPARAAYEAYWRKYHDGPVSSWEAHGDREHEAWDAAAQAAVEAWLAIEDMPAQAAVIRDRGRLEEQLAAVTADRDRLAAVTADILSRFGPSGSGHTARVGQVQIARWRQAAGLED